MLEIKFNLFQQKYIENLQAQNHLPRRVIKIKIDAEKWGARKACFVGRGKAKIRVEFPACRKCNIVSCALTKRVAAVGVQRSRTVGKAHTASPQQDTGTKKQKHIHRPGQWMCFLYASFSPSSGMRLSNHRFLPWRCEQSHRC